jgi:exonuclease SbcC
VLLELEGFGAFSARAEVRFDEADFFALVGPTGSGKSTVIDGICFALYGTVPRYGDQRKVDPVVSLGSAQAAVRLTFEVGGRRYLAARVLRRNPSTGKATTREARLERLDDGAVLAGQARELDGAVEALLGLTFSDFTRCVVLPQGEFARFLHDKPAEREQLLVRLLDLDIYGAVAQRANAVAKECDTTATLLRHQLDELPAHDDATLAAAAQHRRRLLDVAGAVEQAGPELAAQAADADRMVAEVARLRAAVASLERVRVPSVLGGLEARRGEARRRLAEGEAAAEEAERALLETEGARAALGERGLLDRALDAHGRVEVGRRRREELRSARAEAAALLADARATRGGAEDRAAAATQELEAARARQPAHALRHALAVGEPCPVCDQVVTALPPELDADAIRATESAAAAARRDLAAAESAVRQAQERLDELGRDLERVEVRLAELEHLVVEHPHRDDLVARIGLIEEADRTLAQRRGERDRRRAAVRDARAEVEQADASLRSAASDFERQRDTVSSLGPPPSTGDLAADWDRLAAWAAGEATALADEAGRSEHAVAEQQAMLTRRREELLALARGVGVAPLSFDHLPAALARADATAALAVESVEQARSAARRLGDEAGREQERGEVARSLGIHLGARNFQRWLIAEILVGLMVRASRTLFGLSGGRYSLAADGNGELWVVDHQAADELRSVRSLSGGETFQASLALALALADEITERAGAAGTRLEAIFLDEGFGTLDSESLETVASTIETLGHEGRMVGLVTHVRELAERVPVRFRVVKGPGGSRVEREVA